MPSRCPAYFAARNASHHARLAKYQSIVRASAAKVVFAPLGIGRHVDHLIMRRAAQDLRLRTVYYSDFPYSGVPCSILFHCAAVSDPYSASTLPCRSASKAAFTRS